MQCVLRREVMERRGWAETSSQRGVSGRRRTCLAQSRATRPPAGGHAARQQTRFHVLVRRGNGPPLDIGCANVKTCYCEEHYRIHRRRDLPAFTHQGGGAGHVRLGSRAALSERDRAGSGNRHRGRWVRGGNGDRPEAQAADRSVRRPRCPGRRIAHGRQSLTRSAARSRCASLTPTSSSTPSAAGRMMRQSAVVRESC